jgi:hypothetical protein
MRLFRRPQEGAVRAAIAASGRAATADQADRGVRRLALIRVVLMRLVAGIWLVRGLTYWSAILLPRDSVLDQGMLARGAAVVYFAVLDPTAAVGLWLGAAWGGIIWVFAVLSQIIAAAAIPGFASPLWIIVDVALVGIYLLVSWLVSRAAGSRRRRL